VSIKTVSTYRSRILRKSGMTSNAELVRHAVEHRLVE
jgi:DNA-binding NarL/FixJ family response regulator